MHSERRAQYLLYFTLFQVLLGFGIVIPVTPFYVAQLGGNSFHMGLFVSFWAGAQFLFSPVWGAVSDRWGRRPVILVGLAGYALTFMLMAISPNIWVAIGARFLGGLLSAATIPTAQAYIADISTQEQRGPRLAGMGAAMNLGFILGPTLGGVITYLAPGVTYAGLFVASAAMAIITWVSAYFMLPEPVKKNAVATKPRKSMNGLQAVKLALSGPESLLYLLAFGGTFGGSAMFSMLGLFMMEKMGADEFLVAVALTVEGTFGILFQVVLMRIGQRFREESLISAALIAGAIGFFGLTASTELWHVLVSLIGIALCLAFVRPLVTGMVSKRTRLEQGATMGIQTAFDALGRTVGPAWAGLVAGLSISAPFLSAAVVYVLFLLWCNIAWRRGGSDERLA